MRSTTERLALQRHELRKMGCSDGIQVFGFGCPAPPGAQEQLHLDEGNDGQSDQIGDELTKFALEWSQKQVQSRSYCKNLALLKVVRSTI
jgi:hypothetical protein